MFSVIFAKSDSPSLLKKKLTVLQRQEHLIKDLFIVTSLPEDWLTGAVRSFQEQAHRRHKMVIFSSKDEAEGLNACLNQVSTSYFLKLRVTDEVPSLADLQQSMKQEARRWIHKNGHSGKWDLKKRSSGEKGVSVWMFSSASSDRLTTASFLQASSVAGDDVPGPHVPAPLATHSDAVKGRTNLGDPYRIAKGDRGKLCAWIHAHPHFPVSLWHTRSVKKAGGWKPYALFPFHEARDHELLVRLIDFGAIALELAVQADQGDHSEIWQAQVKPPVKMDWDSLAGLITANFISLNHHFLLRSLFPFLNLFSTRNRFPFQKMLSRRQKPTSHLSGKKTPLFHKKDTPKISVLMAVFNGEREIGWAIYTVLAQNTEEPFELVVVDDGSTDRTSEVVRRFHDSRIRLVKLPSNQGKARAMNAGLSHCRGEYIYELDADDWLEVDALSKAASFFEVQSADVACIYGDRKVWLELPDGRLDYKRKEKGDPVHTLSDYLTRLTPYGPRIYRREIVLQLKGWPFDYPSDGRLYEDVAMFIRILLKGYKILYVPHCAYHLRARNTSVSRQNREQWESISDYFQKNYEAL